MKQIIIIVLYALHLFSEEDTIEVRYMSTNKGSFIHVAYPTEDKYSYRNVEGVVNTKTMCEYYESQGWTHRGKVKYIWDYWEMFTRTTKGNKAK